MSLGVPGETPTDLKSLARGDAVRTGFSPASPSSAPSARSTARKSEALRSILASQAVIMAAREERVSR